VGESEMDHVHGGSILFDIDVIRSLGRGKRVGAWKSAFRDAYGIPFANIEKKSR
jgi:hypothetical protein